MAFVFIDDDYYKITLEFIKDSIGNNYDEWKKNNKMRKNKISIWEIIIYFKKLNNVSQYKKDYYLSDAESNLLYDSTVRIKCMKQKTEIYKSPVYIKLNLSIYDKYVYALENYIIRLIELLEYTKYAKYYKSIELKNLYILLFGKYRIDGTSSACIEDYLYKYNLLNGIKEFKLYSVMELILISIIKKHYIKILDNCCKEVINIVDGYIIRYKMEKINIDDINKNEEFVNFIKEYVKSIYGFYLI